MVWVPVPLKVTVPVPQVNVPELAQLPDTVNEAVDEAVREPLLVMVTLFAAIMRSYVSLSKVVLLVSEALPIVRVPPTMIWPVPPVAAVMVRSPAEEFSNFRLLNVQLVAPEVVPKLLAAPTFCVKVLVVKLIMPASPVTLPHTSTSAEPFELSNVPKFMLRLFST